jgi:hypothetical protein
MEHVAELLSPVIDAEHFGMDMERRIDKYEQRHQRWSLGMEHRGDGKIHVTESMDVLHCLKRMEAVPTRIAQGSEVAVKLDRLISGRGAFYTYTSLGKAILELYMEAVPLIEQLYPDCRRLRYESATGSAAQWNKIKLADGQHTQFNEQITVMLHACQRLRGLLHHNGFTAKDVDQPFVRKALEHLVRFVRRACRSESFKAISKTRLHNEQENFRSYCEGVATAFEECSKLLVMRVDLYHPSDHDSWVNKVKAEIRIRRFLRAVKANRIVPDVKLYICKRENAPLRGTHFHLLVALDGHKHCAASAYSRDLCKAWDGWYSGGLGTSFNCYARRNCHEFNGLGLVHISDREKLMGIRAAIKYMMKGESWMRTGFKRNLWRGRVRWLRSALKRGAPRKAGHDMSLVNAILGGG